MELWTSFQIAATLRSSSWLFFFSHGGDKEVCSFWVGHSLERAAQWADVDVVSTDEFFRVFHMVQAWSYPAELYSSPPQVPDPHGQRHQVSKPWIKWAAFSGAWGHSCTGLEWGHDIVRHESKLRLNCRRAWNQSLFTMKDFLAGFVILNLRRQPIHSH